MAFGFALQTGMKPPRHNSLRAPQRSVQTRCRKSDDDAPHLRRCGFMPV
jgi:hypothetical protein